MPMKPQRHPNARQLGFTLAEAATVIVIVALVLGGIMMGLPTQIENARQREARALSDTIQDALVGYALSREYLPCPDTDGDALEQPRLGTGDCPNQEGWLPSATLSVNQTDPWGNRVRYRVAPEFSRNNAPITLATTAASPLNVCADQSCTSLLAQGVPAVWVMHGNNGLGARSGTGFTPHAPPTSASELENTNIDNNFVMHEPTSADAPAGEFDDLVGWLSTGILLNRLVEARVLP